MSEQAPISFVIITYNRPADMLALCKNIATLEKADALLREIIIVNNQSTADYSAVEAYIQSQSQLPFRYTIAPENLGVARGRNYALQFSTAPIIIMLDDDAEMGNPDCLIRLLEVFEQNSERSTAIVSFKVLYHSTGAMQENALPHKNFAAYKDKSFFETYYFAGGAHAIKRSVLDATGNYPEDFFYGMEEYDLSYRIINKGYRIVYSDKIIMLHKESPEGRTPTWQKLQMMWVNKSKVAWRYLPTVYFYTTAFMWSLQYLKISRFYLPGFVQGWRKIAAIPATEQRTTISAAALDYLQKLQARLTY
ncbi:MAG: glycosyltransferase family 2 protein [Chitinophagaceae bacterium]|nr:glycosyltransferase family 2 protein [Chitinophagaceae bacterium]